MTAAVVGENYAVGLDFDCAKDVFYALDALEDDGHFGDALEPGDVFPAEAGVDEAGDGACCSLRSIRVLSGLDIAPLVGEFGAHVLFSTAELGCVNGDEEALAAAGFGVLYDFAGDFAVFVDVELQPLDLVALTGVDDFVKGTGGERGYHLDDVVFVCGAGEYDLALGVA